jgi:hypothetical protein
VEVEFKIIEFVAIKFSPTPKIGLRDANTEHEMGLEPVPLPIWLVIVKLTLAELFTGAVPDTLVPETEYVGPAIVTWLDAPVPIVTPSAA